MLTKRTLSKSQKLDRTELLNIANEMYDGSVHYRWPLPNIVVLRRTTLFQPMSPPSGPCNAP